MVGEDPKELLQALFIPGKPDELDFTDLGELIDEYGSDEILSALKEARIHHVRRGRALSYARGVCRRRRKETESGSDHDNSGDWR